MAPAGGTEGCSGGLNIAEVKLREEVKQLQRRLGVAADGVIGPKTLAAIKQALDHGLTPTGGDVPHWPDVRAHLLAEEGSKASVYQDHLGYWTIGVGRLVDARKGGRLRPDEVDMLLANDVRECVRDLTASTVLAPAWRRCEGNAARAVALISMRFQLGKTGLESFRTTLSLLATGNFEVAAHNARQSLWARQTPERAARVTRMIETGRLS